jgi:Fe2+ or Zn2+ uptake regulation protein
MEDTAADGRRQHLPKNYRLIDEIVQGSGVGQHLTTSAIHAMALKRRPGIGFVTIYRGLERLRELGLVSEVLLPGANAAVYEPSGPRHAHFRCKKCGAIQDVDYAIAPPAIEALALAHGFTIETVTATFGGCCAECGTS